MRYLTLYSIRTLNKKVNKRSDRISFIRKTIYGNGWLHEALEDSRHELLWKKWQEYLNSDKEDTEKYFDLVITVKRLLGDHIHEQLLHCSRFYHRTEYLRKKGLTDTFSNCWLL